MPRALFVAHSIKPPNPKEIKTYFCKSNNSQKMQSQKPKNTMNLPTLSVLILGMKQK